MTAAEAYAAYMSIQSARPGARPRAFMALPPAVREYWQAVADSNAATARGLAAAFYRSMVESVRHRMTAAPSWAQIGALHDAWQAVADAKAAA